MKRLNIRLVISVFFIGIGVFYLKSFAQPVSESKRGVAATQTLPVNQLMDSGVEIKEILPVKYNIATGNVVVLRRCVSNALGLEFACDPLWKLKIHGKVLVVTVSESPEVTITFEETEKKLRFMHEISRQALESTGRYSQEFDIERVVQCGREFVKVKAFAKDHPKISLTDYYFVDHNDLHTVFFSVAPKDALETYKFLLKEVADSIKFVKRTGLVPLIVDEETTCSDLVQ